MAKDRKILFNKGEKMSKKYIWKPFYLVLLLSLFIFSTNFYAKGLDLLKEKSFSVKSGQLLTVKTDLGDVIVKTWGNDEVLVKIYGDSDAKNKMEFSFDQVEDGVNVIGEKEGSNIFSWLSDIDLKYEIKVPTNFDLIIKTSGGDIVTKQISGDFQLNTSGGDVYVKNTTGNLNAGTSGGDITLADFSGDADLGTSGGDIEVDAENGKVFANTSGGDIIMRASDGEIQAKTSGGDISLNYSGANFGVFLKTSGGDIDVKLPMNFNADVDVRTSGGDLTNNFSENKMTKISKSKLQGKFNDGGNELICKTSGGDISIYEK